MTYSTKITTKGQMTLSAAVRKELGINPGDSVLVQLEENKIVIKKDDYWRDLDALRAKANLSIKKHGIEPATALDIKDAVNQGRKEAYVEKEKDSSV